MKKILPFLFVLIGLNAKAQIVNIPDPNFKNALLNYSPVIDLNFDGEIQITEAAATTSLNIESENISDLTGIAYFTNLTHLYCPNNNLTSLDVSALSNLYSLYCYNNLLSSLNLNNCAGLNVLNCSNMMGNVNNNQLTSLDLSGVPNLLFLTCDGNPLTSLNPSSCTLIQQITCRNNQLTSLNVSGLSSLTHVTCTGNMLTNVNVSGCTALFYLDCQNNQIASLDLSTCNQFQQLLCSNNQISTINLTGVTGLTHLLCQQNVLTSLNVSGCPNLAYLDCRLNQLTSLNVKNGPGTFAAFSAWDNPTLQYVCADEAEMSFVQNHFIQNNMLNVNINPYCSFTPGGSYNTINGTVRIDNNNNGCDASDPVIPELIVKINDGTNIGYTSSNSLGVYSFYTNAGNYTITPQTANPYFTITPASASINFATAGGNVQAADFCFAPNGVHPDLEISVIALSVARPGFDASYQLVYKNKGTTTLSGNVELIFDDARVNLMNANPVTATQSTNLLTWTYSNLAPFESRTIDIKFNLLPPPSNNINDTLNLTANITPLAGDGTPGDNGFITRQVILGSFDPNDKSCLEGAGILVTDVGDYVHYLVRFQNTGTDTAFNVVIKDLLTNKFNWNSFEVTKTSHSFVLRQTNNNKLEFIFENINLPDSNINEPLSHGFIAFKIKTIPTLVVGDSIKNSASIYFDFNLPVITNTATSYIVSIIIVPISIEYFKGSIQSGNHFLSWKAACTSLQAIFDVERSTDGRKYTSLTSITASNTRCLQPFDFTDNNPAAGINYYRIKMTDVDGKISYSTVIALLNKKTGFEIVNLLPNPVTNGTALLNITSAEKQIINIKVSDVSGKIVQSMDQSVISGFTNINMNFSKLAAGIYTISIYTNDGERKTKQFIKK